MTSQHAADVFLHDRILDKFVLWMIPRSVRPNYITILRIILTPLVVWFNYRGEYHIGIPLFLCAAFTDALDGSLARTRDQITDLGKLLDPFADKLLIGSMVVLLVFRYLPHWIGWSVIGIEIVFVILATAWRIAGKVGQANAWGKIKMILQVIGVFLILLGLTIGNQFLFAAAAWLFGAAIIFAVLSLFFHGV